MRIQSPVILNTAGLLGATVIRSYMSTLDYRLAYYDPTVDPVHPAAQGQKIFVFWHEYLLCPIYGRGHCNFAILLSQHRDADILGRAAHHLGFDSIRGSTTRGSAPALRAMLEKCRHKHLTITPDGPQGPRRRMAQGPIFLASKLGIPLVAMGFGYDRPWRLKSWDQFAIPKPYSRARIVVSPALPIPPDLDRDGLEHHRDAVEKLLNRLTLEAEAWAEAGTHKIDEYPGRREHVASRRNRVVSVDAAHDAVRAPHARSTISVPKNQ
jgi:lysophospholipid acyltransferase (LPLAT)-like uncharacterized protein